MHRQEFFSSLFFSSHWDKANNLSPRGDWNPSLEHGAGQDRTVVGTTGHSLFTKGSQSRSSSLCSLLHNVDETNDVRNRFPIDLLNCSG